MRLLAVGGFLAAAAGAVYFFGGQQPGDVYNMPVSEAYAKLTSVNFGQLGEGEKVLNTVKTATGNGKNKVVWAQQGDMAAFSCDLALAPLPDDAAKTHVTVTCEGGGAGDGAAAGMVHNMHRNAVIERVDATLTDRPFDRAKVGTTASRWPGDGVDGSLGTAMGGALKMDADMHRELRQMEKDDEADRFNAPVESDASGGFAE